MLKATVGPAVLKTTWIESYCTNWRKMKSIVSVWGHAELFWMNTKIGMVHMRHSSIHWLYKTTDTIPWSFLAKEEFSVYPIQSQWPLLWLLFLNTSSNFPAYCSFQLICWLEDTVMFTLCHYLLLANVVQRDDPC